MAANPLTAAFMDDHIFRLTDDTGMLQHSKYSLPDPNHGYTTDDNARALIMALMLYERYESKKYLDLVYRYASFLLNAQNENGRFRNFMGYDRKWLEEEGSEDCFGRCLWALGFAISNRHTPKGVKNGLIHMLGKAVPHTAALVSPRAKAYSVIGLAHLDDEDTVKLIYDLANSLSSQYDEYRDGEWKVFEYIAAYSKFVLPWSMLVSYRVTGDKKFLDVGAESLDFFGRICFRNGYFKPVGCNGWLLKGGQPAEFDEQPVEACEGVLTYLEAYRTTGRDAYLQYAEKCHQWYLGLNSLGISLIDAETGGCYDGLTRDGPNLNMGAESIISYAISHTMISGLTS